MTTGDNSISNNWEVKYRREMKQEKTDIENGLDSGQFDSVFNRAAKKDYDASKIFKNLDQNNDGILDKDELSRISRDGKTITSFDIFNYSCSDEVASLYRDDEDFTNYAASDTDTNNTTDAADTSTTSTTGKNKFKTAADAMSFFERNAVGDMDTYQEVIDSVRNDLSAEDIEMLELAAKMQALTPEEQTAVKNRAEDLGKSEAEALNDLIKAGGVKTDTSKALQSKVGTLEQYGNSPSIESELSEKQVARKVEKLYEAIDGFGTDEEDFDSVLYDDKINGADMAKISLQYDDEHGSLLNDILGDFSGDDEDKRVEQYATKLVEAANSGDENAIKALAKEMYNSMDGGGTCEKFVETVMNNANDEVLAAINNNFSDYTGKNTDLQRMIKGDFSGKTEDKYISQIKDAVANVGEASTDNLSSSQIENNSDKIYDAIDGAGTNEEKFEAVLYGQQSPDDVAAIAKKYNKEHGSLLNDIRGDYSGKTEDKHVKQYAEQLVASANSGNKDAINVLAKELYNSMDGTGTCEEFVEVVMTEANDDVLAAINGDFKDVNGTKESLQDMLEGDFSFSTEDKYVDRLNDAIANAKK